MTREEVVLFFGADTSQVNRAMRGLKGEVASFGKDIMESLNPANMVRGFAAAFGASLITGKVLEFGKAVEDLADKIATSAEQAGVGTTFLQQWNAAAEQSNTAAEDATNGLGKLSKLIGEARAGSATAAEAFNKWGISLQDAAGNALNTERVADLVADRMAAIEDPTLRSAFAAEIFGTKLGQKLIPMLAQGAEALRELRAQANVISPEQLAAIDKLGDSYKSWTQTVLADGGQVIGTLGQIVAKLADLSGLSDSALKTGLMRGLSNHLLGGAPGMMRAGARVLGITGPEAESPVLGPNLPMADPALMGKMDAALEAHKAALQDDGQKLDELKGKYARLTQEAGKMVEGSEMRVRVEIEAVETATKLLTLEQKIAKEKLDAEQKIQAERERNAAKNAEAIKKAQEAQKAAEERHQKAAQERAGFTIGELAGQNYQSDDWGAGVRGARRRRDARRSQRNYENSRSPEEQYDYDTSREIEGMREQAKYETSIGHYGFAQDLNAGADELASTLNFGKPSETDPMGAQIEQLSLANDKLEILVDIVASGILVFPENGE